MATFITTLAFAGGSAAYAPAEPYKFMAMELDLVPVSGRIVIPDLRWLLGGGFIILFLLAVCVRAVWWR